MNGTQWIDLFGVILLIAVVAVMAASETAITKTGRARAYKLVEEGRRGAKSLQRVVENLPPYLGVVLLLTLLACSRDLPAVGRQIASWVNVTDRSRPVTTRFTNWTQQISGVHRPCHDVTTHSILPPFHPSIVPPFHHSSLKTCPSI